MGRRALRSVVCAGLACLLAVSPSPVLASAKAAAAPPAAPAPEPPVERMAALGDSITRGFNACGWFLDCPSRSWATGTDHQVDSHYLRLLAHTGSLTAYNNAVTGAKVAALAGQAEQAVAQRAEYVTILIGANDACADTEADMTSVAAYERRFRAALQILRQGLPEARIFVSSIPDLRRLWRIGKDNAAARTAWAFGICQSMLARPTSMADADMARRTRVRERVIAYNAAMARACEEDPRCRFDGGAVFSHRFTLEQVSKWDYFHPNLAGQAELARVTYAHSFWPATVRPGARPVFQGVGGV